jgi:arylsulfatase A-like enzyme
LCDYAGIEVPEDLRGRSLRDLAEGREPHEWRDHLVMEVGSGMAHGRCVHTGRYKYTNYNKGGDPEELFDLEKDPGEVTNLIGSAEHASVVADSKKRLAAWRRETSDPHRA